MATNKGTYYKKSNDNESQIAVPKTGENETAPQGTSKRIRRNSVSPSSSGTDLSTGHNRRQYYSATDLHTAHDRPQYYFCTESTSVDSRPRTAESRLQTGEEETSFSVENTEGLPPPLYSDVMRERDAEYRPPTSQTYLTDEHSEHTDDQLDQDNGNINGNVSDEEAIPLRKLGASDTEDIGNGSTSRSHGFAGFSSTTLEEMPVSQRLKKVLTQVEESQPRRIANEAPPVQAQDEDTPDQHSRWEDTADRIEECPYCGALCATAFVCICETCSTPASFAKRHRMAIILGSIIFVGLILFVSIFPVSFRNVDYDQIALLKTKSTGAVDKKETYYSGCYVLGPDKEFRHYPSTSHFVDIDLKSLSTSSRLEIGVNFSAQYFVRPNEAGLLYAKFALEYEDVFKSMMINEIKNKAVIYSLDDFRYNRAHLEKEFHKVVQRKLGGTCCGSCCPSSCADNYVMCSSCNNDTASCSHGYHVDVRYFQMQRVTIPLDIAAIFTETSIQAVEAEREVFYQGYAVKLKEIDGEIQTVNNQAREVTVSSIAQRDLALAKAATQADKVQSLAEADALKGMCLSLGISREDHKISLFLIRSLSHLNLTMLPDSGYITGWGQL